MYKKTTYYKVHHKKHSRISLFTLENGNKDEKKKEIFMLEEEYHLFFNKASKKKTKGGLVRMKCLSTK